MGRKKKYHTEEERKEAQLKWQREWYERNKVELNAQRMEKYYERKNKVDEKLP
jgi:hypothetical protein|tara:strand:- start:736 stop:894 length:159 start_codon:yes stop_codon:yes gene_type:complete